MHMCRNIAGSDTIAHEFCMCLYDGATTPQTNASLKTAGAQELIPTSNHHS